MRSSGRVEGSKVRRLMPSAESEEFDLVDMLKKDHRKVEQLFKAFSQAKDKKEKKKLAKQVAMELKIHAQLEEELVYPELKDTDEDTANEAYTEHGLVKFLLKEMAALKSVDSVFEAKMKVLEEVVKHHVKEEESKAFPELKESDVDLQAIAQQLVVRKEELKKRFSNATVSGGKDIESGRSTNKLARRRTTISRTRSRTRSRKRAA